MSEKIQEEFKTEFLKFLFFRRSAVDRFPILECDREIASNSIETVLSAASSTNNLVKPSLHLHFKTEHKQGSTTPEHTPALDPKLRSIRKCQAKITLIRLLIHLQLMQNLMILYIFDVMGAGKRFTFNRIY
uniref:Uncharacterized protein n=1 Tax=Glossina brevipalpis TaxID=37001 RepID=A0A1A9W876_9MUSC